MRKFALQGRESTYLQLFRRPDRIAGHMPTSKFSQRADSLQLSLRPHTARYGHDAKDRVRFVRSPILITARFIGNALS
jgi:hypothetical protein